MKKYVLFLLVVLLSLGLGACQIEPPKELSDEEVVTAFLEAFCQGDYEGLMPYISDDNPLHLFFTGMQEETGGEMAPVYQALHEKLKDSKSCGGEGSMGNRGGNAVHSGLQQCVLHSHDRSP